MAIVHKLQVPNSSGTNVTHTLGTIHYIVGTGTTAGTWLGTDPSITEYYDGLVIAYKLNVAGATTTTLNINSLGAKTVYRGGTTKLTTQYTVDSVVLLVYTTTSSTGCWQVADYDANTTYTPEKLGFGYGTCSTAAGTAAKAVTLSSYTLVKNGFVAVKFDNAVTSSSSTMNINSKGAKAIYYNGAALGTNVILAGDVCLFVYDGSYYHLLTIDRAYNGSGGITVDNATIKHSNSVTAGTAQGDATKTLSFGGTFTIPTVTYDAQGHITAKGTTTMTMPSNPNTNKSHKIISGTKADGSTNITSASASSGDITLGDSGVTAGEYGPTANATPGYGGTFNVPDIKVNSKGIVTSVTNRTVQIPASDNSDTKNTAGSTDTSSKIFLIGATSQAANPQTYSHDTAYVGTDGCLYSGGSKVLTSYTDTKNTAGSTNTSSKIYLVGATSQAANPQTYSHDTAYVDTDGHLYSNSAKVFSTSYAPEAYLQWGGKSVSGGVTPIGMSLSEEHSGNKAAFINGDAISVEYSTDGTTFTDAGVAKFDKTALFTTSYSVPIGGSTAMTSSNYTKLKTRITLTAQDGGSGYYLYTDVKKILVNMSSSVSSNMLIETLQGDSTSWVTYGTYTVSGWSGWNDIPLMITLGGSSGQKDRPWKVRFTFSLASYSTSYSTTKHVTGFRIFGQNSWNVISNLARTGHLYSYDVYQNATFPAGLNTTGNLTENGTRVSKVGHTHTISGTAASNSASTSTNTGSAGAGSSTNTGSTTPTFTGESATTSSAGGGTASQATGSTTPTFTGTGVELVFTGSSATSGSAGAGSSSTTGANSGDGVSVVTGVTSNGTATALTGVKASGTDTFVKSVSGGSGSLEAYDAVTGGTKKVSNGTRIPFVTSISSTGASGTSTSGFLKSINGGSGSLTSNDTSTDGIAYISGVSHTAASLTGTKTFNTDAIKSVALSASTTSTDGPAYVASISGGSAVSKTTKYMKFSAGSTPITASVSNGVLTLASGTAPSMNFNTGTSTDTPYISSVSGGSAVSATTRYMKVTPTAATTGTVGISGGSISTTTKYLHHTHTGASAGTTASAITAVSGGTTTATTHYLAHGHTAASAGSTGSAVTGVTSNGTATVLTGVKASGTATVAPNAHTHSYSAPSAHTHSVTAKGTISVGTGTANYTPAGTVSGHTHTYTKPAAHTHTVTAKGSVSGHTHTYSAPSAHTHTYNAPAAHTHTVSGSAAASTN